MTILGELTTPTLVIGDVHGCLYELQDLLVEATVMAGPELQVVSVGDLIDKGPMSLQALQQLKGLNVHVVQGNHETKALHDGSAKDSTGDVELGTALNELNPVPWVSFVHNDKPYLCVHGGLLPARLERYGSELEEFLPDTFDKSWKLTTMVRKLNPQHGGFVSLDQKQEDFPYWWEVYGKGSFLATLYGKPVTVLHGHHPMPWADGKLCQTEYTVNLDTGCVFGGWLTGMLFAPGEEPRFLRVQAGEKYAEAYTPFPLNEFLQYEMTTKEN